MVQNVVVNDGSVFFSYLQILAQRAHLRQFHVVYVAMESREVEIESSQLLVDHLGFFERNHRILVDLLKGGEFRMARKTRRGVRLKNFAKTRIQLLGSKTLEYDGIDFARGSVENIATSLVVLIRIARDAAVFTHPLIVMRIVDDSGFDGALGPTECGFALGAPHLVTSVDFRNARPARRTRSRVFLELLHRIHVFLLANVVGLLAGDGQKTFRTSEFVAQIALVLLREHPATSVVLTLHDELARGIRCGVFVHFASDLVVLPIEVIDDLLMFRDDFHDGLHFKIALGDFSMTQGALVEFGDFGDGAIGQDGFAVVFVVVVHENRVKRVLGELQTPLIAALHAMGLGGDAGQISSCALFASRIRAAGEVTSHCRMVGFIIVRAANVTSHGIFTNYIIYAYTITNTF